MQAAAATALTSAVKCKTEGLDLAVGRVIAAQSPAQGPWAGDANTTAGADDDRRLTTPTPKRPRRGSAIVTNNSSSPVFGSSPVSGDITGPGTCIAPAASTRLPGGQSAAASGAAIKHDSSDSGGATGPALAGANAGSDLRCSVQLSLPPASAHRPHGWRLVTRMERPGGAGPDTPTSPPVPPAASTDCLLSGSPQVPQVPQSQVKSEPNVKQELQAVQPKGALRDEKPQSQQRSLKRLKQEEPLAGQSLDMQLEGQPPQRLQPSDVKQEPGAAHPPVVAATEPQPQPQPAGTAPRPRTLPSRQAKERVYRRLGWRRVDTGTGLQPRAAAAAATTATATATAAATTTPAGDAKDSGAGAVAAAAAAAPPAPSTADTATEAVKAEVKLEASADHDGAGPLGLPPQARSSRGLQSKSVAVEPIAARTRLKREAVEPGPSAAGPVAFPPSDGGKPVILSLLAPAGSARGGGTFVAQPPPRGSSGGRGRGSSSSSGASFAQAGGRGRKATAASAATAGGAVEAVETAAVAAAVPGVGDAVGEEGGGGGGPGPAAPGGGGDGEGGGGGGVAASGGAGPTPLAPEKLGDRPLRLMIVGHNPSAHAWQSGHQYSNPSNHLWRIFISTGIAPTGIRGAEDDDRMPAAAGVGFIDVGTGNPSSHISRFKSNVFDAWSMDFYSRLRSHMQRASASIGCSCGTCGAPSFVAFNGKRQYLELLNVDRSGRNKIKTVEVGPQALLPSGWPFPPSTEVWVCSSTSGAAVLTREEREEPYVRLAERLWEIEWPRRVQLRCGKRRVSAAARGAAGQAAGGGDSGTAEEASG